MTNDDKNVLIKMLEETHTATNHLIKGLNLDLQVYEEPSWRIRDILGHISTWNRQTAKSLEAFNQGEDYSIPGLEEEEDGFNEAEVTKQGKWSTDEVLTEWHQANADLKTIVQNIPDGKYPGDLLYPWGGERGTIFELVKYMANHDREHRQEIEKSI